METKTLYILRSVSGAGKTTLAKTLEQLPNTVAVSADDYWYIKGNGDYDFDVKLLSEAHSYCKNKVEELMLQGINVIVHNTSTTEKEIHPYTSMAERYGYKVISLVVENRHGNKSVHDVPENIILNQATRLRNNIKFT